LSAIHRDPRHDWTVEELAQACSLSRSAFAARFVARVGKPPATYLGHVRLDAATGLLRDTSLPVTLIAQNVDYMSEAAFSRAFKHRLRHATGSLATRHTSETLVSSQRAARPLRSVAKAAVLVSAGW
jgi:transcriptional regulator GlxA family with amidase domain